MSNFEPDEVAGGERTDGAARQPDTSAVRQHAATRGDVGDRGAVSPAATVPKAIAEAESPVADGPAVTAESPVAAALAELEGLAERPVADHPGIYGRVHAELQTALGAIDDA